jgi:DNA repair exonuclease SbcCD ATPase subunit
MIEDLSKQLLKKEGERDSVIQMISERETLIKRLQRDRKNTEEALRIIQLVGQQTQQNLERKISEVVTLALSAVFDDPYKFKVSFEIRRGKTEADLVFGKDGATFDPMTEAGGGVVDVASFALRIASWWLSSPKSSNTIILDEPFRFLSKSLQPKASAMLAAISKKLGIQFIIVTHIDELKESADKIFLVEKRDGKSVVKEM